MNTLRVRLPAARLPCSKRYASGLVRDRRMDNLPIDIHPEVEAGLHDGTPLVALESTIITHGFPHPGNVALARSVETIVRSTGAIPATIALLKGRITVGLTPEQIEEVGRPRASHEAPIVKVSRRDLAPVIALGRDGGTTISGTMILAALAGIKVFATGGLGGVHRGGEKTWDVSADLTELGRTPVAVVAAGAKSILDIGRTLEYLETQGVTVATYGDKPDFPAFFTPSSGFKSPWAVNNPADAARIIHAAHALGLNSGQFFGVPIPESHHAAGAAIQAAVDQAVRESEENGISQRGKEVTPWLLHRIAELTKGESLSSNVALIENTARVGGEIAVQLAKLEQSSIQSSLERPAIYRSASLPPPTATPKTQPSPLPISSLPSPKLVVIGASAIDITSKAIQSAEHSTSPGTVDMTLGGVGRNVAEAAHRRSPEPLSTLLVSPIGNDSFGTLLKQETSAMDMRVDGLFVPQNAPSPRTPVCNLVLDVSGNLVGGVADFEAMGMVNENQLVSRLKADSIRVVAVDANLPAPVLGVIAKHCRKHGLPLWFEPTSTSKCSTIFPAISSIIADEPFISPQSAIAYASPNILELKTMYDFARSEGLMPSSKHFGRLDSFGLGSDYRNQLEQLARVRGNADLTFIVRDGLAQMAVNLLPYFQHLIIKCGNKGVLVVMLASAETAWKTDLERMQVAAATSTGESLVVKYFPPLKVDSQEVVSTTGAGDSLVGSLLADLTAGGLETLHHAGKLEIAMERAQRAAVMSLMSCKAVSPDLRASS